MEVVGTDVADHGFVARTFLEARQITETRLPATTITADLTSPAVSEHGVTSELTGAISYELTQQWALALKAARFGGITYGLRFRPNSKAIALFGATGQANHPVVSRQAATKIAAELNIPIEDPPALDELEVVHPH